LVAVFITDGTKDILSVPGVFSASLGQIYLNACGVPK
jgi:hypothetical protein